tara:strand:+ start:3128 stop:3565 length:438 start_codon:yes stop_codon:yes gene_type:complete
MILETATALICMAHAIYFEARSESTAAQIAVGHVILNRVEDPRFPDNVCEVVTEGVRYNTGQMKRDKCQFSFYCDGKPERVYEHLAYMRAEALSFIILDSHMTYDITDGATHYHATYVNPVWANRFTRTTCIDSHCFYRADTKDR